MVEMLTEAPGCLLAAVVATRTACGTSSRMGQSLGHVGLRLHQKEEKVEENTGL